MLSALRTEEFEFSHNLFYISAAKRLFRRPWSHQIVVNMICSFDGVSIRNISGFRTPPCRVGVLDFPRQLHVVRFWHILIKYGQRLNVTNDFQIFTFSTASISMGLVRSCYVIGGHPPLVLAIKQHQRFAVNFRNPFQRTPENRLFLVADGLLGRLRPGRG